MFVEGLMLVTYRIILVAKPSTLYTNISSRASKLLYPPKCIRTTYDSVANLVHSAIRDIDLKLTKILSFKKEKQQNRRNFGKKRHKQSKAYSYKLRKSYTHTSTTEFRRQSSKNEGAPGSNKSDFTTALIRRMIPRFLRILIYKQGKSTRVSAKRENDGKEPCSCCSKMSTSGKGRHHPKSFRSKTKNEGVVDSECPIYNTVIQDEQCYESKVTIHKVQNKKWQSPCCARCLSTQPVTKQGHPRFLNKMYFDTDSYEVKVDTGCSVSLSGVRTDFVPGTLREAPSGLSIQSYGGTRVPVTHMGTIRWYITDDTHTVRELLLPRSLYVPTTATRLLSPQHLAQVTDKKDVAVDSRTSTTTYSNHILLQWTVHKYRKTIELDNNNIGTVYTAPGYNNAQAFFTETDDGTPSTIECHSTTTFLHTACEPPGYGLLSYEPNTSNKHKESETLVREPDALDATLVSKAREQQQNVLFDKGTIMELAEKLRSEGIVADFETKMFKDTTKDPVYFEETYADIRKNEDLLLLLHQKFGHISMTRLQRMAKLGMLPKRISDCPIPICQACIYGKMTRRQWRSKQSANKEASKVATAPGEIVSVDQLESPIGGFIAQMKGKLFQQHRYRCATVFVDHFSGLSFVYLQQSTSAE